MNDDYLKVFDVAPVTQTPDERIRVFDEWGRNFAPEGFLLTRKNAVLLNNYVLEHDGVASITGLNNAVKALAAQLEWAPVKSANQIAIEKAAEGDAKMRKDYWDSLKQRDMQSITAKKGEDVRKIAAAKEIAAIEGQISSEIASYVCGHHSGVTDYGRTEAGKEIMRGVLSRHNRTTVEGAKLALEAVRVAKAKLP